MTSLDVALWGESQRWTSRVILTDRHGGVLASSDHHDPALRFKVVGGTVTESDGDAVGGECSLDVSFPWEGAGEVHPLIPTRLGDPLDPNSGSNLIVFTGPAAGTEVQLGVFDLASTSITSGPSGDRASLKGYTLERAVRRAGFWRVQAWPVNSLAVDMIDQMVEEAVPGVTILGDQATHRVGPLSYQPGDDRLDKLKELAALAGVNARFDRQGRFTRYRYPDWSTVPPKWTMTPGLLLGDQTRELTDEDVHNGAIVYVEPMEQDLAPTHAEAWITDPAHPLYFDPAQPGASTVGPLPFVVSTNEAKTEEQAADLAYLELTARSAGNDVIGGQVAAWPDLQVGDMVRVVHPRAGINGHYSLTRLTHSLVGSATTYTAQRRY